MSPEARVFSSAKLIAACTLLSRITGLAREIVLNAAYGQSWIQDAFNYGFQVPNLFRRLFGEGALSAVFVPTFTEVLDRDGRDEAWRLLGRVTALLTLVLVLLTIVLELAVLVIWWYAPGEAMRRLMLGLTAVMLPFMISICVLALLSSILNCVNHFTVPALSPIVLNLCNIAGVLLVGPAMSDRLESQVYGVAISVLAAGVLQLAILVPILRQHGVRLPWSLGLADPRLRGILRTFVPILLGQGVLLFNVFLDAQICTYLSRGPNQPETLSIAGHSLRYPMEAGALSAVNNATRLYQFPLGVLAISLATAAFPMLSRQAARGDMPALRTSLGSALRMAVFEGLPAGLVMMVLAEPIVALLFQYGRFGPEESIRAAAVLRWYGIGMWAFCAQHIVLRGFYSVKDTLTPMWIGCGLVALNQAINLSLVWHPAIRESAFGISTSMTSMLHVGIGLWILRRRTGGRIGGHVLVAAFLRTAALAVLATGAAWAAARFGASWELMSGAAISARALRVFIPLMAAIAVYLVAARVARMDEVRWLVGRESRGV